MLMSTHRGVSKYMCMCVFSCSNNFPFSMENQIKTKFKITKSRCHSNGVCECTMLQPHHRAKHTWFIIFAHRTLFLSFMHILTHFSALNSSFSYVNLHYMLPQINKCSWSVMAKIGASQGKADEILHLE